MFNRNSNPAKSKGIVFTDICVMHEEYCDVGVCEGEGLSLWMIEWILCE